MRVIILTVGAVFHLETCEVGISNRFRVLHLPGIFFCFRSQEYSFFRSSTVLIVQCIFYSAADVR